MGHIIDGVAMGILSANATAHGSLNGFSLYDPNESLETTLESDRLLSSLLLEEQTTASESGSAQVALRAIEVDAEVTEIFNVLRHADMGFSAKVHYAKIILDASHGDESFILQVVLSLLESGVREPVLKIYEKDYVLTLLDGCRGARREIFVSTNAELLHRFISSALEFGGNFDAYFFVSKSLGEHEESASMSDDFVKKFIKLEKLLLTELKLTSNSFSLLIICQVVIALSLTRSRINDLSRLSWHKQSLLYMKKMNGRFSEPSLQAQLMRQNKLLPIEQWSEDLTATINELCGSIHDQVDDFTINLANQALQSINLSDSDNCIKWLQCMKFFESFGAFWAKSERLADQIATMSGVANGNSSLHHQLLQRFSSYAEIPPLGPKQQCNIHSMGMPSDSILQSWRDWHSKIKQEIDHFKKVKLEHVFCMRVFKDSCDSYLPFFEALASRLIEFGKLCEITNQYRDCLSTPQTMDERLINLHELTKDLKEHSDSLRLSSQVLMEGMIM